MRKLIPLAIAYDFDGTLAAGNMQERDFIPAVGMTTAKFWKEVRELSEAHEADNILMYMRLMIEKADAAHVTVRRQDFRDYGKKLAFFDGVEPYSDGSGEKIPGWFDRIDEYGKQSGVKIDHYIISSGIREMVEGSKIAKKFKKIYASSFLYDHHGIAKWPALALNYTTKTQYLFRINKGTLHVYDHGEINNFVPHADRPVPFTNMMFIGDGETDIPCFRLVKEQGGHSVAVYEPSKRGAKTKSDKLLMEGRVNLATAADYREGSKLDLAVKAIIDKTAIDSHLARLLR